MKKSICIFLLCALVLTVGAQDPIAVGVWERFDARIIPVTDTLFYTKEVKDGLDNDSNGYIDDVYGIGFDKNEKIIQEDFLPTKEQVDNYEHGTMVASIIANESKVPVRLVGVGFEYTSIRLATSGLLNMTVKERKSQLKEEFKRMHRFVQESIRYFEKEKVEVVNISWGLNLDRVVELNENFGDTQEERLKSAKIWLKNFKKYLKNEMQKHPDMLFVISVGNEGKDIDEAMDVPASIRLSNAIIVGGLDKDQKEIANFSNTGSNIDVWAPSDLVTYQSVGGKKHTASGVSVAAPFVTANLIDRMHQGTKVNKDWVRKNLKTIKTN